MSSIDKRIVEMQFNNKGFESGVKTTLASLKELNEKLKMKDAGKGFDSLTKAAKGVNIDGIGKSVDTVTARFSALGVVGATVLANITNSALNAGKSIVNAFTLEPIKTGFQEYETKINAIQTILSNTAHQGTTLPQVTKALNELNTYADKTIYNFAQMTENIGRFTAAGVDLDTSVASIKGIANLAAASGSTPQQASSAMYQLSQAIAAGKVSLMDWNSVVNAGMGGKLFQDALKNTAEAMGINIDKSKSFRDSLQDGWLTAEVMTKTLQKFADDPSMMKAATEVKTLTGMIDAMKESVQSGWAQSWEYIIGDKDQATKTLTAISDAFNNLIQPSMDARNKMLEFWNTNGGREAVIKGLTNVFGSLGKGLGAVKNAFSEVFPPMTGKKLVELSKGFKDFTEKIKMSDETAGKIKDTFKGIFSAFSTVGNAIGSVVKGLTGPLISGFGVISKGVLTVTSGIGKFVSSISSAINKSGIFNTISSSIGKVFGSISNVIKNVSNTIDSLFDYISKLDFSSVFKTIGNGISGFANLISPVINGIGKAIGSIDINTIFEGLNLVLAGNTMKTIKDGIDSVQKTVKSAAGAFSSIKDISKEVSKVLSTAREALEEYQNSLKADVLMKIAGAILMLAGALILISNIKAENMQNALSGVAVLFMELMGGMALFMKVIKEFDAKTLAGLWLLPGALIKISAAVLILSGALRMLGDMDWTGIAKGLVGISGIMAVLIATTKLMDKAKGLTSTSIGLIAFSIAIRSMAEAVKKLGDLNPEELYKGLIGIGALLAELSLFMSSTDFSGLGMTKAAGILVFAAALNVLAVAVNQLGGMNTGALVQGLAGMLGVLAELALFSNLTGGGVKMIAMATGITILSVAMNILAAAVKSFGSISWESLAKGLIAMASALTVIGIASAMLPKNLVVTAVGITAMAAALMLLSVSLNTLGGQSWEGIAKSMVSLAGALLILGVAMTAMSGCLLGASAMLVMAGALAIFIPQLIALSGLSLTQVGIGLLALAGAFTVLGVAGLALTPIIPSLFALAGVIALLGVGCMAAGAGLALFGTGLGLVAAAGGSAGLVLVEILRQLINLLPQLGIKAAEAITNFANAFTMGLPTIITAITGLMIGILQAISNAIPQIIETGTQLITALCTVLTNSIPQLITVGTNLIIALLQGISSSIGQIVQTGCEIVVNFLNGVASNLGQVIQAGINLAIQFINGVANGLRSNQGALTGAVSNLISAMISTGISIILGGIGGFLSAGLKLIMGMVNGIKNGVSKVSAAVKSAINAAKSAASGAATALVSAGKSLIEGFISGIKSAASKVAAAAKGVVQNAIDAAKSALKINSPSKVFIKIGGSVTEGFVVGLKRYADDVVEPAANLSRKIIESAKEPLADLSTVLTEDLDSVNMPTITPVMDLSQVKEGTSTLGSMISDTTMSIAGVTGNITKSIGKIQNGNMNTDIVNAISDLKKSLSNVGNTTYHVNGITYDDGSNITNAVETLVRAARIERRI